MFIDFATAKDASGTDARTILVYGIELMHMGLILDHFKDQTQDIVGVTHNPKYHNYGEYLIRLTNRSGKSGDAIVDVLIDVYGGQDGKLREIEREVIL